MPKQGSMSTTYSVSLLSVSANKLHITYSYVNRLVPRIHSCGEYKMAPDRITPTLPIWSSMLLLFFCLNGLETVKCQGSYELRLVNGSAPNEGRVEMRSNSSDWMSLCGAYWDIGDGSVVCQHLGFTNATSVSRTARFGSSTGRIMSTNYQCTGSESHLEDCPVGQFSEGDCQHSADPGVVCYPSTPASMMTTMLPNLVTTLPPDVPIPVRLMGGNSPFQGRVEVYLNNAWGTICDDSWDTTDARIVCRQLGFQEVFAATTNARFGQGLGPIQMDDTRCYGSETSILDCQHRGIGVHNCRHTEDAGVICLPESRLAGGSNHSEGRVEVRVGEQWQTVCGVGFDDIDANIVCNQMGYGEVLSMSLGNDRYGNATGTAVVKNVNCNSNFQLIRDLPELMYQCASEVVPDGDPQCTSDNDVGIVCSNSDSAMGLRLVGGNNIFEGRVEVNINNTWGTVCDDYWDMEDASVVCNQLGLGRAVEARKYASFGRGFGPIHMDDVLCSGDEATIFDCEYNNQTGCSHSEDAGVVCAPKIRLMGGMNSYQGRVEMFVNDEWSTICDTQWDEDEARVACRQLKYGFAATAKTGSYFGEGTGPILAENIRCSGYEGSLVQCPQFGISPNTTCDHSRDAGVICSLPENNITLRLVGGENAYEGRIDIELDGIWGTVCDNNWDKNDARVVCKQLGLGPGIEAAKGATFGPGTGPIYVDNLACRGHESSIAFCPNNGVEVHNCTHDNDAGVVCSAPIRLVDGSGPYEGRVEILRNIVWGTVCDDGWDIKDATVVCNELGFGSAKRAVHASYFGSRSYGSIHMDNVACEGDEQSLTDCPHDTTHDCSHLEDAGVICTGKDIDDCSSNPCENGGTCVDLVGSYSCRCREGFVEANCQTRSNECSSNPCINGRCVDYHNRYMCECDVGYTGSSCDTEIDDCSSSPCGDNGVCVDGVNSYQCICMTGYSGSNCHIKLMCSRPSDPPEGTEFTNPTNLYFYGDVLTVSCRDSSASTLWICLGTNKWNKHELVCTTDSSKQTLVMISALLGVLLIVFIITCAIFIIYRHRTGSAKLNTNNGSVRMTGGEVHFEDGGISNPSFENVSADTNYNGAETLPKKDVLDEEHLDLSVGSPVASNGTYLGTLDNVPLHPPTYTEA